MRPCLETPATTSCSSGSSNRWYRQRNGAAIDTDRIRALASVSALEAEQGLTRDVNQYTAPERAALRKALARAIGEDICVDELQMQRAIDRRQPGEVSKATRVVTHHRDLPGAVDAISESLR